MGTSPSSPGTTPGPGSAELAASAAGSLGEMIASAARRGRLPEGFIDELLTEPSADAALAALLSAADSSGTAFGAGFLVPLGEVLLADPLIVRGSRATVPLLSALRRDEVAALELLRRPEVLDALIAGPAQSRRDREVVRVLEAVADSRALDLVALVVRRFGAAEVDLDRLGRGATALLVGSFDEVVAVVEGATSELDLHRTDLDRLLGRLSSHPLEVQHLSDACARHGRVRMARAALEGLPELRAALEAAVELFRVMVPNRPSGWSEDPGAARESFMRVVGELMRLTAVQLLLQLRGDQTPGELRDAWPSDEQGHPMPVSSLNRTQMRRLLATADSTALV